MVMTLLSYLEQLVLLIHTQRMEALPFDVLQTPRFKGAWLKLDPQVRNCLFTLWWGHYRAIAWWMRLPLLKIYQLLSEKEFEAFVNVRPEADFATARFLWARRVYLLSPLVQEFTSLENFCYALEASDFIKWIELTGVMGSPALSKEGRLLGKTEGLELDITALEALKNDFKLALSGDLCPESLENVGCDPNFEPTLTDEVLVASLISVIGSDGDDTALASAMKVIDVGSPVRKRYKKGWRGTVTNIQGEWAYVLWEFEKYPERISLTELKQK